MTGQDARDEIREHAHRTREARDECARGRCNGDVRYDLEPFDDAPPQEARDDEREALDSVMNAHVPTWRSGWHGCKCGREWPEHRYNPPAFISAVEAHRRDEILAAGYRKHPEPEITDEMVRQAVAGIAKRLTWPSIHWGAEHLHRDALPHIARAALETAFRVPVGEGEQ